MMECIVVGINFSNILLPGRLCPIWVGLTLPPLLMNNAKTM